MLTPVQIIGFICLSALLGGCDAEPRPAMAGPTEILLRAPSLSVTGPLGEILEGVRVSWHRVWGGSRLPKSVRPGTKLLLGPQLAVADPPAYSAVSGQDGSIGSPSLPPGMYRIQAEHEGWFGGFQYRLSPGFDGAYFLRERGPVGIPNSLGLQLSPSRSIKVRVVAPDGRGAVGVPVHLKVKRSPAQQRHVWGRLPVQWRSAGLTDAKGEVTWRIPEHGFSPDGLGMVHVEAKVYDQRGETGYGKDADVAEQDAVVELQVPKLSSVHVTSGLDDSHLAWGVGRLTHLGDRSLESKKIYVSENRRTQWSWGAPRGGITLGCFLPGTGVFFAAKAEGFAESKDAVWFQVPAAADVPVRIPSGEVLPRLNFNVTDADGQHVRLENARIQFPAHKDFRTIKHSHQPVSVVPQAEDGGYSLGVSQNAPGAFIFVPPIGDHISRELLEYWPPLMPNRVYDLGDLPRPHLIPRAQGVVVNELGEPLSGAEVRLWQMPEQSKNESRATVITKADGSFTFYGERSQLGTYAVQAQHAEKLSAVTQVEEGGKIRLEALPAGRITGKLEMKPGFARYLQVTVKQSGWRKENPLPIRPNGLFSSAPLLPGDYFLRIWFGLKALGPEIPLSVRAGETTTVPLTATNARLDEYQSLRISIFDPDGTPAFRASVRAYNTGLTAGNYRWQHVSSGERLIVNQQWRPLLIANPGGTGAYYFPRVLEAAFECPPFPTEIHLKKSVKVEIDFVPPLSKELTEGLSLRLVPLDGWSNELERRVGLADSLALRHLTPRVRRGANHPGHAWCTPNQGYRLEATYQGLLRWTAARTIHLGTLEVKTGGRHQVSLTSETLAQLRAATH